ncbi:hypothetical protein ABK040_006670 [Willaertia magna]
MFNGNDDNVKQKQEKCRKLRMLFSPPELLNEDGSIDESYFRPNPSKLFNSDCLQKLTWSKKEDEALREGIKEFGEDWTSIILKYLPDWDALELKEKTKELGLSTFLKEEKEKPNSKTKSDKKTKQTKSKLSSTNSNNNKQKKSRTKKKKEKIIEEEDVHYSEEDNNNNDTYSTRLRTRQVVKCYREISSEEEEMD